MDKIFDSLSTRELAWAIWIVIAFVACMFGKGIRQSIFDVLKSFFAWKILVSLLVLFGHTALCVFMLFKLGFWDSSLLKDTVIWTLGFGLVSLLNINKISRSSDFANLFFEAIKYTIAIEFIVNFFTFSLTQEIIIIPILVFSGMMQAFALFQSEYKQVEDIFKYILTGFGLFVFFFSVYKTVEQHSQLFTVGNFKSLLLPVFLSITFLPFIYLYNLLVKYEELWTTLNFRIRNKEDRRSVKRKILWTANLNIVKLVSISKNISKPVNAYNDLSCEMIKTISKSRYVGVDEEPNEP